MDECIFCKIVNGTSKARVVYQDAQATVFHDLHPVAPIHLLVVPNRHIDSVNALEETDTLLAGHLLLVAQRVAAQMGLAAGGYRLIINTGPDGGQTVFHLHLHLLGGRRMRFLVGD
jgi:histidine triad (HIT) family protein